MQNRPTAKLFFAFTQEKWGFWFALVTGFAVLVAPLVKGAATRGSLKTDPDTTIVGNALAAASGVSSFNAIRSGLSASGTINGTDDGATAQVPIGFTVTLSGSSYTGVYVNNNGNVTFDAALAAFEPSAFSASSPKIIAPFFADVDTRGAGSGLVTYGTGTVNGYPAFGANWPNVGFYSNHTDKQNNFQAVLISRADTGAGNFDIELNYGQIQWESGDANGGSDGLGGLTARAGYVSGTAGFLELPGSGKPGAFLDTNAATGLIYHSLNSTVQGRYLFRVRNGAVVNTPPVVVLPAALGAIYGSNVTLDASPSYDPQNLPLSFQWIQISGAPVALSNSHSATPSFTAPTTPDTLAFIAQVSDGLLASTGTVSVYLNWLATLPATKVVSTNAVLNGQVIASNAAVYSFFDYGTTATYGTESTHVVVNSGTAIVSNTLRLTNLTPNTAYHFRYGIVSTTGTVFGTDATFTTPVLSLPTIATGSASMISGSGATLSATVNPNGLATTASFQYGLDTSYSSGTASIQATGSGLDPVALSGSLTGLAQHSPYHWRVVAVNTSGTAFGPDQVFSTIGASDVQVFAGPISITGPFELGGVVLTGTVNPNGNNVQVWFDYGTSTTYSGSTAVQSFVSPSPATQYIAETGTLPTLSGNTTYHWCMLGKNLTTGSTFATPDQRFTTQSIPAITLSDAVVTGSSVTIAASVNPNGISALRVALQFRKIAATGASSFTSTAAQAIPNGSTVVPLTFVLKRPTPADYQYQLVVASNVGVSYSTLLSFTNLAPTFGSQANIQADASGATITGTANPNGTATSIAFLYGLTTSYGSVSDSGTLLGSGTQPVSVPASLTGLAVNTLYHVRAVTTSALGTFYGPDITFTTAPRYSTSSLAVSKSVAPGISGTALFSIFGNPIVSSFQMGFNGPFHDAFSAMVTGSGIAVANNLGIWADLTAGRTLIARAGSPAPGVSGTFLSFDDPVLDSNDRIAFTATLKTGGTGALATTTANNGGVWATYNGVLGLVARKGTQPPGYPPSVVFTSFDKIALPDRANGVVILAKVFRGNTTSKEIWAVNSSNQLTLLVRTGDGAWVNGVAKQITGLDIFSAPSYCGGQGRNFHPDMLTLDYRATYQDGTQSINRLQFP